MVPITPSAPSQQAPSRVEASGRVLTFLTHFFWGRVRDPTKIDTTETNGTLILTSLLET